MKTAKEQTTQNWITVLNEIKNEVIKYEIKSINDLFERKSINRTWSTFLIQENIIKKVDGIWYWNENVKIDNYLTEKYRKFHQGYWLKYKNTKSSIPTLFDKPKTPVKRRKKVAKVEQISVAKQENQVGIIRKFIKWLW